MKFLTCYCLVPCIPLTRNKQKQETPGVDYALYVHASALVVLLVYILLAHHEYLANTLSCTFALHVCDPLARNKKRSVAILVVKLARSNGSKFGRIK